MDFVGVMNSYGRRLMNSIKILNINNAAIFSTHALNALT